MGDTEGPDQESRRGGLVRQAKETLTGVGFAVSTQGVVSTFVPDGLAADLLSAGAAPVAQLAVVAGVHVARRLVPRLLRIIGVVSHDTDQTQDEVIEIIRESLGLSDLFARVMEAAAGTRLETKIYALGKALAQGVSDPEHLDEAHMLVEALAAIEQPHAVLLGQIVETYEQRRIQQNTEFAPLPGEPASRFLSREDIQNLYPPGYLPLRPVLARLTAAGLLYNPSPGGFGGAENYAVSPMGERCLELLQEAATHAP